MRRIFAEARSGPLDEDYAALRRDVERILHTNGVSGRVVRIFPPHDTGEDVEVLLLAEDETPCRAFLSSHAKETRGPVVQSGW